MLVLTVFVIFLFSTISAYPVLRQQPKFWPTESSITPHLIALNFEPFEAEDDAFYRDLLFVKMVQSKSDELRRKISVADTDEESLLSDDLLPSTSDRRVDLESKEKDNYSTLQFPDKEMMIRLRQHINQVRFSARRTLEAGDRLLQLSDEKLSGAVEDLITQDIALLLYEDRDEETSAVKDFQEVLCPALEREAREMQEKIMIQVLDAVGTLLGEQVTQEQISEMYSVVKFVNRFQGQFSLAVDKESEDQTRTFSWTWDPKEDGSEGSKTVKKVLL